MFPQSESWKRHFAIPVSTRAIGFSVVDVFQKLQEHRNSPSTVNIYQMYRTFLGYFESKMLYNRRRQFLADFEAYQFRMNVEMMRDFSYGNVPDPLSKVINAMAPVESDGTLFCPVLSPDNMVENVFMPSPERVTYSNLRKTVEALSNEQVPAEIRAAFYHNNPIPGAIWHGGPSNPILQNGDEIMPKNYTLNELDDDLQMVRSVYNFLNRKNQNYFNSLDRDALGSTALFVSNEMGDLKTVDRDVGEELNAYQQRIMVQGNVNRYWNIRNVAPADQFLGCYILAGEVPSLERFKYPNYVVRDERNVEQKTRLSYRSISLRHLIQNTVNNKYGVKSIAIPITTRAIGFSVVDVFDDLKFLAYKKNPPQGVNIYQMYRTSLAYFESKMRYNRRQFIADFETYEFPINLEMMELCSYGNVPKPLSLVINAMAPVKAHDTNYYPILLPDNMVENVFMPSPERVTYSNLRKTVEALSNEQVPAEIRAAFYDNNPIPGAVWNGEPKNPILQNGDEIMPKDYTLNELSDDLMRVRGIYGFLNNRKGNYFYPFDHKARRSTALFVCNKMGDLKIVDRNVGEELNEYQKRRMIQGNVDEYWNIRNVASADQSLGCYILAGEVPTLERFKYPNYVVRDERNAVQMANEFYRCALSKIISALV